MTHTKQAYESDIDVLMREMRADPKIEAEHQRNWRHWWQGNPARRDSAGAEDIVRTQSIEHDMAYASRRAQRQGGQG